MVCRAVKLMNESAMGSVIFGSVENISGSGYGYGDGSGYGSGYGDGSGYGSGDGYGYGSGSGSGSEAVAYQEAVIAGSVGERGERLREQGAVLAFWRSDIAGRAANHSQYDAGPERKVGTLEELPGPLEPCTRNALHATLQPAKFKGDRLWIVAMYPPVVRVDNEKMASLKREILAEVPNWFK